MPCRTGGLSDLSDGIGCPLVRTTMPGNDDRSLGWVVLLLCVGLGMVVLGSLADHQPARTGVGAGLMIVGLGVILAGSTAALFGDPTRGRRRERGLAARLRAMAQEHESPSEPAHGSRRDAVSSRRPGE